MKVGLLGLTGGVGTLFAEKALARGHSIIALARTPSISRVAVVAIHRLVVEALDSIVVVDDAVVVTDARRAVARATNRNMTPFLSAFAPLRVRSRARRAVTRRGHESSWKRSNGNGRRDARRAPRERATRAGDRVGDRNELFPTTTVRFLA